MSAKRRSWKVRAHEYLQRIHKPRQRAFYRCAKCRRRKVLSRELWLYTNPPRCCGGAHWLIDLHRYKEWKEKTGAYAICRCGNSPWPDGPHKPGSVLWCVHSKATAEDLEQAWLYRRSA